MNEPVVLYKQYRPEPEPGRLVWADSTGAIFAEGGEVPPGYTCKEGGHAAVLNRVDEVGFSVGECSPGMTLPTDSAARKEVPLFSGCLAYFPAALAEVAKVSKIGNDKHNAGEPLHHARGKSPDHQDCILRHTMDAADLRAAKDRGLADTTEAIIFEKAQRAWRDLADLQETIEELRGVPMAPAAW